MDVGSEVEQARNGYHHHNEAFNGTTVNANDSYLENKTIVVKEVREKMKSFWKEHSQKGTEKEMLLDTNADVLGREELPEILSMLPNFKGKDVLELGAGIGRFTGKIATKAKSVVAVDFMDNFVKCNKESNGHMKNITFLQADVIFLDYPAQCFDLVFSNWLFMYLEEKEVESLFSKIFDWLRPGGYFYFRESCFHQSGNKSRDSNPSQYRKPSTYNEILKNHSRNGYSIKLILSKSIQTYIKLKSNRNQICWLVQKVPDGILQDNIDSHKVFGENLDSSFFSLNLRKTLDNHSDTECVFPREDEILFEKVFTHLKAASGDHVLHIGCGHGYAAFQMAKYYNVKVYGVDPSASLISWSLERANILKQENIQFQVDSLDDLFLPMNEFDAVLYFCSTDIGDHGGFFSKIKDSMKPHARLVVVDYCLGPNVTESSSLLEHIARCKYHILTVEQHKQVLNRANFEVKHTEILTDLVLVDFKRHSDNLQNGTCHDEGLTQNLCSDTKRKLKWLEDKHLCLAYFVAEFSEIQTKFL